MPEGDTIFRTARTLERALGGQTVTRFETVLPKLARIDCDTPLAGRTVDLVESRGKWLLMHFSGDLVLLTHMLMSGSWHIYRPGEKWQRHRTHMRIVVETPPMLAVAFNVPVAEFHTARSLTRRDRGETGATIPGFRGLNPGRADLREPLGYPGNRRSPASAFTSSSTQHGGQESTLITFYITLLHLGMIIVGLPYSEIRQTTMSEITGGSPYGSTSISGVSGSRMPSENELAMARFQGKHVTNITCRLVNTNVL